MISTAYNYPKWSPEIVEFEPLDGKEVFIGAKAKQIRKDSGTEVESTFEITDYQPTKKLVFKGLTAPYKHSYLLENDEQKRIVLSVWDRMFGTRKELIPKNIGLDLIEAENFIQLFSLAFITELKIRQLLGWIPKGKK